MNSNPTIYFSSPDHEDAPAIYDLVKSSPPLDLNSRYAYMLVASHFAKSSIVAKVDEKVVGLVSAYRLPEEPSTLFVWQVAVDESMRGKGLALSLVLETFKTNLGVKYIETTITPSNLPSQKLFAKVADRLNAPIQTLPFFSKTLFGKDSHEDENLYRIGPINNFVP